MKSRKTSRNSLLVAALAAVTFSLAVRAQAQTESVLYSFNTGWKGFNPYGGLVFDSAGNLYGTTYNGGNPNACNAHSCGVVFELSPSSSGWTEKAIHTFSGGWDGAASSATLIIDGAGNLYGTTTQGGDLTGCRGFGCGVVFKLSPQSGDTWTETVLHAFTGGKDGSFPTPNLTLDGAGNLYGTTTYRRRYRILQHRVSGLRNGFRAVANLQRAMERNHSACFSQLQCWRRTRSRADA